MNPNVRSITWEHRLGHRLTYTRLPNGTWEERWVSNPARSVRVISEDEMIFFTQGKDSMPGSFRRVPPAQEEP